MTTERALEQAQQFYSAYWHEHPLGHAVEALAEFRSEGERAAFEKACKAVCDACAQGVPIEDGRFHRSTIRLRRSQQTFVRTTYCRARRIRAAFPHLAETETK
jgi:hypothetical protein